jgi:hypothetical protein
MSVQMIDSFAVIVRLQTVNTEEVNRPVAKKPGHASYSSITGWTRCGEAWRLQKIEQTVEHPAWYSAGGSAFHTATEAYDLSPDPASFDVQAEWEKAFQTKIADTPTPTGLPWRIGGRATKDWPNKEDDAWWNHHGPIMVQDYIGWRTGGNGWSLWHINGEPAVEAGFTPLAGEVPVKMFIDRIMVTPTGELVIVDLKTGKMKPQDGGLQLAFYRWGIKQVLGVEINYGAYYMSRTGSLTELMDLSRFNNAFIEGMVTRYWNAISNDVFVPNTSHCGTCGVSYACQFNVTGSSQPVTEHPAYM